MERGAALASTLLEAEEGGGHEGEDEDDEG